MLTFSLPFSMIIATLVTYACAAIYMVKRLICRHSLQHQCLSMMIGIAILLHGASLYLLMVSPVGINVSIANVFSLVIFGINSIVIVSGCRKPLHNLFILLLPLSLVAVFLSLLSLSNIGIILLSPDAGIGVHILLSLAAYSLLSISMLQALLLHWQNRQLKHKHLSGFVKHLPPLQTMEALMFELLQVGVLLLTGSILLGALYIEDVFAQHLLHKTLLSIVAWCIFVVLLWGRRQWGWRGNQAVRWVLGGFCLLMLAYFGSKLVLEVILQ